MTFDIAEYEHRLTFWSDMQAHMPFLRETAASYAGPVIIELGTRTGQSTAAFLAGLGTGQLWSADIGPAQVPAHWRTLDCWHFLQADDVSPEAIAWLPAECDVLFIDTSHDYQHTLSELALHVPRVRPAGVVLCHDTMWEDPGGTLDTPDSPVARALNDYCAKEGLTWENRTGDFGMGVLRI